MEEKKCNTTENNIESIAADTMKTRNFTGYFDTLYDMIIGYLIVITSSMIILITLPSIIEPYLFIISGAQIMCMQNLFHNFITDPFLGINLLFSAGFLAGGIAIHFSKKWGYSFAKFFFAVYVLINLLQFLALLDISHIFGGKGAPDLFFLVSLLCMAALFSIVVYLALWGAKKQIFNTAGIMSLFATFIWAIIFKYFLFDEMPHYSKSIIQYTPLIFHVMVIIFGWRTIKKYYNSYE